MAKLTKPNPDDEMRELLFALDGLAGLQRNELASKYVRQAADTIEAQADLIDRLKLEAQGHASEARTANSTIYEIYQIVTGGKGEPGNWNGAAPVREAIEALRSRLLAAEKALEPTDAHLETAAQALFEASRDHFYVLFPKAAEQEWDWSSTSEELKDGYRTKTRAVITALHHIRGTNEQA